MAIAGNQDKFFDELETMAPEAREGYLNQRLCEAVDHAYRNAPATR